MKEYEYEYIKNTKGHVWKKDEDGEVDIFGLDVGHHNGPICIKCGYSFCHHCQHGIPELECPNKEK